MTKRNGISPLQKNITTLITMAIIKCPECGQQISDEATVCPICGEKIAGNIVKCTNCGEVYFKDNGICPHCYSILPHGERREAREAELAEEEPGHGKEETPQQTGEAAESSTTPTEEETATPELGEATPIDDKKQSEATEPSTDDEEETEEDDLTYIDTDEENLEKPIHIANENTTAGGSGKHNFIPIIVSLAITALIAAVCLYFYNDSKLSRENQAFQLAIKSGNVNEMNSFLRNFTDASSEHKIAIKEKIAEVTKQKEDLSMSVVTRDKEKILQFLTDYPDTPQKSTLLAMIDSIDWETALASNKKKAYEEYIAAHGNGLFVKEAKEKIAVKVIASTPEDEAKAKSLFREFFLSVNSNDASRLTATLNPSLATFMGTNNAGNGDVVSWMHRQHGDDVSSVIWKLNHDYKITKREQNSVVENTVEFTAKRTIIKKDGQASSEHFKVSAMMTGNNKVSSMSMTKYTPKPSEQSSSSSSTSNIKKEGTASSSNSSSNKQSSSSSSKPSNSNQSQAKSSSSSSAQKSSSSSSAQKSSSSSSTQKSSSSSSTQKSSSSSSTQKSSNSNSSSKSSSSSSTQKSSGSSSSKNNNSGSSSKTTTNSSSHSSAKSSSTKQNAGSNSSSKGSSGNSSKSSNTSSSSKSGSSSGKSSSSNSSKSSNSNEKK